MTDTSPATVTPAHVHILMGTFNGGRWLGAQLDSFLAQTHPHWTLWVSDDGSSDDTILQLEEFASRHPGRVARILDGPQQGSAANFLHLLCHPDLPPGIVALSDQDDVWMPHKLARAVEQLQAAGPASCVWSARYMFTNAQLQPYHASSLWLRGPSLGNALVQNILSGHTLTLNPAAVALMRRGGIQAVPHHDWWIYLVMMACGGRALVDAEIVLLYRQHCANAIGGRASAQARRERFSSLMKGQMRDWIEQNLRALHKVEDLPLTATACEILRCWQRPGRRDRVKLLRSFDVHRQSRLETALLYLAAATDRL